MLHSSPCFSKTLFLYDPIILLSFNSSFIHSRPQMEEFLSQLLHFQHFQQFLNSRIDNLNLHQERDMFDEEVIMFDEGMCTCTVL